MALYNVFHSALFRIKDLKDGTGIYRTAARLQQEQYLTPDKLDDLRRQRLRSILLHAGTHSPYYRQMFAGKGVRIGEDFGLGDLTRIPVLTRELLQDNESRILCPDAAGHFADASGGSTGRPVNFYHDQEYVHWGRANEMLYLGWMNIRRGDKTAIFWGADRDLKDESLYTRIMLRLDRVLQLNSFNMTEERIESFLTTLNRFRPRYIYGYASSLHHVARFINEGRPLAFKPVAVRSSAEMLYDFQRVDIEKAFRAPVYNFYGSREVNNVAAECFERHGLHIFASGRIVEIVDPDGNPVPSGETGHVAVTDLTNRAFPFIRYLNGDMGAMISEPCKCGRNYPRLEKIVGRSSDIIEIDGQAIHGEYFTHLFYGRPEIKAFQLVQESEREFTLLVVPRSETIDIEYFRGRLFDKLGRDINLHISLTDHIPPTAGGKHRFTISKVRPRSGSSKQV